MWIIAGIFQDPYCYLWKFDQTNLEYLGNGCPMTFDTLPAYGTISARIKKRDWQTYWQACVTSVDLLNNKAYLSFSTVGVPEFDIYMLCVTVNWVESCDTDNVLEAWSVWVTTVGWPYNVSNCISTFWTVPEAPKPTITGMVESFSDNTQTMGNWYVWSFFGSILFIFLWVWIITSILFYIIRKTKKWKLD